MSRSGIGSRGGIGSSSSSSNAGAAGSAGIGFKPAGAAAAAPSSAPASRPPTDFASAAAAASSMVDDDDEPDYVSMSLDSAFEGGQWINGEFYYTAQKARRKMTKEEQLFGYDSDADREFYAQQRALQQQQQPKKKMAGGINFVLGSTLQPEQNAKQLREKEERERAAAVQAAASTAAAAAAPASAGASASANANAARNLKRTRDDRKGVDSSSSAAAASPSPDASPDEEAEASFRELRAKKANAPAANGGSRRSRQEEMDEAEEQERRAAGRGGMGGMGGGIGFGGAAAAAASSSSSAAAASAPSSRAAPSSRSTKAPNKDIAQFTRHTTGFGLRMLSKSGYRIGDRLGKHAQGVAEPILPKLRPKDMGLGFGNFAEVDKKSYARNAQEEEALAAREAEEAEKKKAEKAASAAAAQAKPGWKKDGPKGARSAKPKREYKTAAELIASDTQTVGGAAAPLIVMDYRGTTAKLTSLDQVSSAIEEQAPSADSGPAPQMLPELQHNLRLLVSMSEDALRKLHKLQQDSQRRIAQLADQKTHVESSVEYEETQITALRSLLNLMDSHLARLKAIPRSAPNSLRSRIEIVLEMLRALAREYRKEFTQYEVAQRSLPVVYPLLKGLLHNWAPLETPAPTDLPVLDLLAQFKPLLSAVSQPQQNAFQSSLMPADSSSLYHQLLEELLLPRLHLELSNKDVCSVRVHHAAILSMLSRLHKATTPSIQSYIVSQLVYPLVAHEISAWNPRVDPMPVHSWVLPYTAVLPPALTQKLFESVRLKLAITLQEWSALDSSAISVIAPWAPPAGFSAAMFESLLQRSIVPKLQRLMRDSFEINPKRQRMEEFQAVLPWAVAMAQAAVDASKKLVAGGSSSAAAPPPACLLFRNLLLHEFFPKWFSALLAWLRAPDCDLEEVSSWYQGWKAQFPAVLLEPAAGGEVIAQVWRKGLEMLNEALNDDEDAAARGLDSMHESIQRWLLHPDTILSAAQIAERAAAALKQQAKPSVSAAGLFDAAAAAAPSASSAFLSGDDSTDDSAFLSLILQFATLHQMEFAPALRKPLVGGKQVYTFGAPGAKDPAQVYAKQGVVYRKDTGAGEWKPITLNEMLAQAKQQQQQQQAASSKPEATATEENKEGARRNRKATAAPAPASAASNNDVD